MTGLLEISRIRFECDAPVVGAAFAGDAFVFALGDGAFQVVSETERRIDGHKGVSLCLAAHPTGVVSGGDDGRLLLVTAACDVREIAAFGKSWVNAVAVADESGLLAAAESKRAHVFDGALQELSVFEHPSTIAGLDFDPKGKRVVASHYNGVSVWMAANKTATRRAFDWKGSHLAVRWSPCGRFLVTAMQESAIHGWRVEDGADFRMDGYPMRVRAFAFADRGKKLTTTGAGPEILVWPFVGPKGPMGKAAEALSSDEQVIAVALAARPKSPEIAVGYEDGSIRLFSTEDGVGYALEAAGKSEVAALAWSADGAILAYGREDGAAGLLKVAR